jgi:hypothetical protein
MSVLSYLQKRASDAVLSGNETSSISTSISTLQARLNSYFGAGLTEHFRFGSQTRGTILPRKMDEHSDIDYMIVFSEGGYKPQTYLDRLRRFVDTYYSSSSVKQSSPTIVLELNHIKFDLVPALKGYWSGAYQIPNGSASWRDTNPNDFNATLTSKNNAESYLIKPTIRLAKLWNAKNSYVFDSYSFEKWIVDQIYFGVSNQRDYLFRIFDNLSLPTDTQWNKDRVQRAKDIIKQVRTYEQGNKPITAESEVKKLIPE